MVNAEQVRIGKDLANLIRQIQAQYLMKGKKPPSVREITDRIARKIKQKEILTNEFINL